MNPKNPEKQVLSEELRKRLLEGVQELTKAVQVTYGPAGRYVMIDQYEESPICTKDGVTVAKAVKTPHDKIQGMAIKLLQEVSRNVVQETGDGTTTATILTESIFREALKELKQELNAVQISQGIKKAQNYALKVLDKMTKKIEKDLEIKQVATISANGSEEIGELISSAIQESGKNGIIRVQTGRRLQDTVKVQSGFRVQNGFMSPQFGKGTNQKENIQEKPMVFCTKDVIMNIQDIMPVLQISQENNTPCTIFCEDMDTEVMNIIIVNNLNAVFNVQVVKNPSVGKNKDDILSDLSLKTNARIFCASEGSSIQDFSPEDLGSAARIICNLTETVVEPIVQIESTEEYQKELQKRILHVRNSIEDTLDENLLKMLESRLRNLLGVMCIIEVGGFSEGEIQEKKDRIDDALGSTKSAIEHGILPGGGIALLRIDFEEFFSAEELNESELQGAIALQRALKRPFQQIIENAGLEHEEISEKILRDKNVSSGYCASTKEYVDMYENGIIDSSGVVKSAVQNAVSTASILLCTECGIML